MAESWKADPYVVEWLSKIAERTRKNYIEWFPKQLAFIGMSPTEQILKRFKDLQSSNPKERGFFKRGGLKVEERAEDKVG